MKLMSAEPEPLVLKSIAVDLAYVNEHLVSDSDRGKYANWLRDSFGPRVLALRPVGYGAWADAGAAATTISTNRDICRL